MPLFAPRGASRWTSRERIINMNIEGLLSGVPARASRGCRNGADQQFINALFGRRGRRRPSRTSAVYFRDPVHGVGIFKKVSGRGSAIDVR